MKLISYITITKKNVKTIKIFKNPDKLENHFF